VALRRSFLWALLVFWAACTQVFVLALANMVRMLQLQLSAVGLRAFLCTYVMFLRSFVVGAVPVPPALSQSCLSSVFVMM
jgi:hypothetical protein